MFICLRKNPKTLKMEMGILSVNHLIRASIRRVYVEGVLLFVRLKSVDRSLLILPVKATVPRQNCHLRMLFYTEAISVNKEMHRSWFLFLDSTRPLFVFSLNSE